MGFARFLYKNEITNDSMISADSRQYGFVTQAKKTGAGAAIATTGGLYSGTVSKEYIAIIDSVAGGNEVGEATFKWSDDGGETFQDTGVLTSTTEVNLNDGVNILWTGGTGNDFELGDRFDWKALVPFGVENLLSGDRDLECRSENGATSLILTIDFGAAVAINTIAIYDHNMAAGATPTLKANSVNDFASPPFSLGLTYAADKLLEYFAQQTYRYWQLTLNSPEDDYVRLSHLMLGNYLELSENFRFGYRRGKMLAGSRSESSSKKPRYTIYDMLEYCDIAFDLLIATDKNNMVALYQEIFQKNQGGKPFYLNYDSGVPGDFFLMDWPEPLEWSGTTAGRYSLPLRLREIPRTL